MDKSKSQTSELGDEDYKMILHIAVHTAIDQVLMRLRGTCTELAEKMSNGELPMRTGPQALDMIANSILEEKRKRDLKGIFS